jgi:hypothetical protein
VLLCASNTVAGTPLLLYECGGDACLKNENLHVGQHSVIWKLISEKRCSCSIHKCSVV